MRTRSVAALMFVALVAGCSEDRGSPTPVQADASQQSSSESSPVEDAAESAALQTVKSGFGVSVSDDATGLPDFVWAVALIHNPSDSVMAVNASFSAYGETGQVLGQADTSSAVLKARATAAFGTQIDIPHGGRVTKITVTASPLSHLVQKDEHPDSKFTADKVAYQEDAVLGGKVVGEIVSGFQQNVTEVYVGAACYNSAGEIIGGGEDYIEAVGSGQKVGFQIDNLITTGTPTTCEAYPTLSTLSQGS
jgi:hypothetical protein